MGVRDLAATLVGDRREERAISFQKVWGDGGDWREASGAASVEGALGLPALFGCVDLIAGSIAAMPLQTFRRTATGRERTDDGPLVTSPSVSLSHTEWIYAAVASMLLHGEAIGLETRRGANGWPSSVEWLDPRRVDVRSGPSGAPEYRQGDELLPRDRVVHVRHGLILPGRLRGLSPISMLRDPLRSGLEMVRYELDWFVHGAHPSGVLSVDAPTLTDEQSARIKSKFMTAVKRREPAVLGSIANYTPLVESPSSQGIDAARTRIATDIAIAYHVPPSMLGGATGSMVYETLETDQAALEVRALMPTYRRLEQALSALMPRPLYVRFNADAVLRTSAETRSKVASEMVRAGVKSRDEVRALEELPPIPDGTGGEHLWPPYSTTTVTTGGGQ